MTTTADEPPYFPSTAPAALADAGTAAALLDPVLRQLADVVGRVAPEQSADPTPCTRYDVSELRDHVLGWLQFFAAAVKDPERTRPRLDPDAYRLATDERTAGEVVRAAARTIEQAVRDGVQQRRVVVSQSVMDGSALLAMMLGEYLTHGWDLARALGLAWTPSSEACSAALAFSEATVRPEYRGGEAGMFGAEVAVPTDAGALDRMLGFAGRHPRWAASRG
jgi:uncharacterized protein (TIGR03086 family)